ncbi:ELMO CED-12 family protein, putative [Babesia ovis]|uniref:ELMO CED-12 family protein, putative n=1 Tax=Babesia ovis TaxID=5869 RepID=A0A9W5T8D2_BABOV|nr:ELMO CED-12 family protein, putative [Babesia ovis]
MVNNKAIFRWVQKWLSLLTCISYPQVILLDYGAYDYIRALVSGVSKTVDKSWNPQTLVDFENVCNDSIGEAQMLDLLKTKGNLDEITDQLMQQLNIECQYRNNVADVVMQMRRKYLGITEMEHVAKMSVDEDNSEHCKLFYEIWEALDDRSAPESFAVTKSINKDDESISSWGDLGFQTPMTDFRMTGLLGLKSLHYLVVNHKQRSRKALKISQDLKAWFPFAITSVNVTSWVMEDIKNNKHSIFLYNSDIEPLEVFFRLHVCYFFRFVQFWQTHASTSVFEFKTVSTDFRAHILELIDETVQAVLNDDSLGEERFNGSNLLKYVEEKLLQENGAQ